jgi:hypothetical protein
MRLSTKLYSVVRFSCAESWHFPGKLSQGRTQGEEEARLNNTIWNWHEDTAATPACFATDAELDGIGMKILGKGAELCHRRRS